MRILGSIASSVQKAFVDLFNRTTSGSLGIASWLATRGVWYANGSQGQSDTSASSYPLASVQMGKSDIQIDLDVNTSGGAGIAFWVTDSQNWWGLFPYTNIVTTFTQNCNSYNQAYTCTSYTQSSACNGWTSGSTCNGWTPTSVCNGWTSGSACNSWTSSQTCTSWYSGYNIFYQVYFSGCNAWTGGSSCNGWTSTSSCNSWTSGSSCNSYTSSSVCNSYTWTQSCSTYAWTSNCASYTQGSSSSAGTKALRLVKSVTNVVTTVLDQSLPSLPASLKLITSGNSITGKAYSGTGQTTQIGSDLTSTQTSGGTQHGIIVAPGGYAQGNTVDNITIK